MTRTMWIAVFCLVALGASIAIRIVSLPASVLATPRRIKTKSRRGPGPNQVALKFDPLELPSVHAEADETVAVPPAPPRPGRKLRRTSPRRSKIPSRRQRWQDANARIAPSEPPPHRRPIARETKKDTASNPPAAKAEAWHCRQDAMGSLLRSLDLSPRCNLCIRADPAAITVDRKFTSKISAECRRDRVRGSSGTKQAVLSSTWPLIVSVFLTHSLGGAADTAAVRLLARALTFPLHPASLRSNIPFSRRDPRRENRAVAGSRWSEKDEATGH